MEGDEKKSDSPHDGAVKVIVPVAGCACATLIVGAFLGAAWPAAVVASVMCLMGVFVAFFIFRRS
jgi:hypothetical protein